MKCSHPQRKNLTRRNVVYDIEHACGQCTNCRITRQAQVAGRIFMESLRYPEASAFVTLTYAQENRPPGASLSKHDAKIFKRRLRRMARKLGYEIKVVFQGEYGEADHPHYHMAIFGLPLYVSYTETKQEYIAKYKAICRQRHNIPVPYPAYEQLVLAAWDYKGFVNVGTVEVHSAQYIARYVTKKYLNGKEPKPGNTPEFISWDRKNAIGLDMAKYIADSLQAKKCYPRQHPNMAKGPDWIPVDWEYLIQVEGKPIYLDRYMKAKVLEFMGGDQTGEDIRRIRNYMRSVALRNQPKIEAIKRNKPLIEIKLTEEQKKQQRIERFKAIQRRKRKSL